MYIAELLFQCISLYGTKPGTTFYEGYLSKLGYSVASQWQIRYEDGSRMKLTLYVL